MSETLEREKIAALLDTERSGERQVLAAAIQRRNEARERHRQLVQARDRLDLRELRDIRDAATTALRKSEEEGPKRLISRLMGTEAVDELTASDATQALAEAQRGFDEATGAATLLDSEIEDVRLRIGLLDLRVDNARAEVLKADGAVQALLRRHRETVGALLALDRALERIASANGLKPEQRHWNASRPADEYPDRDKLAGFWHAAIEQLRDDPDGTLPE